jgi:hypothetical protein
MGASQSSMFFLIMSHFGWPFTKKSNISNALQAQTITTNKVV